jgi:hypothetical protein
MIELSRYAFETLREDEEFAYAGAAGMTVNYPLFFW